MVDARKRTPHKPPRKPAKTTPPKPPAPVVNRSGLTVEQQIAALRQAGFDVTTTQPSGSGWVSPLPGVFILNKKGADPNDPRHGYSEEQYAAMAVLASPYANAAAVAHSLQAVGVTMPTTGTSTGATGGSTGATGGSTGTAAPAADGFTPFTPTTASGGTSGVTDPYQPFGQGFGSDYGLNPSDDPNFAFGGGGSLPAGIIPSTTPSAPQPSTPSDPQAPTPSVDPMRVGVGGLSGTQQSDLTLYLSGRGPRPVWLNSLGATRQRNIDEAAQQIAQYGPEKSLTLATQYASTFTQRIAADHTGGGGTPSAPVDPSVVGAGGLSGQQQSDLTMYLSGRGPRPVWMASLGTTRQQNIDQAAQQIAQTGPQRSLTLATQYASTFTQRIAADHTGGGGTGGGTGGTGGTTGGTGTGTQEQQNALANIRQTLNTYGLGDLADWAWQEIIAGKSDQQVLLDLMQTPQFKARFPGIDARQKAGLPPISPGEYVSYENQATQLMRAAGLPSGFWDSPADFTHLIAADVSINELTQRVNLATQAAYQVPSEVRATLARDYGVGAGGLAAFFLDEKTALPLIQRDFTSAQIGGAAWRTGYGSTRSEDERLTDLGVTADQAQQGFTQLVGQRQLFSGLPGENTTGIAREDQLAATFGGNALAQEKVVRRAQRRVAEFSGGGSFSSGQGGFTGIGEAQGA